MFTMGTIMRRIHKIQMIIKVIVAIIGASAGISACIVFSKKYNNTNAAAWAGTSAAFAILFLYIVFSVRRDIERKIPPKRFVYYMLIGAAGAITGLGVFIAYLVIGATRKESVDGKGSYVVVVWGFMTLKFSMFTLLGARSFYKKYKSVDESEAIVNS